MSLCVSVSNVVTLLLPLPMAASTSLSMSVPHCCAPGPGLPPLVVAKGPQQEPCTYVGPPQDFQALPLALSVGLYLWVRKVQVGRGRVG